MIVTITIKTIVYQFQKNAAIDKRDAQINFFFFNTGVHTDINCSSELGTKCQ